MDEAHRQAIHSMTLMYLSSPRCKASHHPEESTIHSKNSGSQKDENAVYAEIYEKLKCNNFLKKKEVAQIREAFVEERNKKIKYTRL